MCPRNFVTVEVVGGQLPAGLRLTRAGYFEGAPQEPGVSSFLVRARNDCGWSDQEFRIEVAGAPLLLANPSELHYRVVEGEALRDPILVRVSGTQRGQAYTVEMSASVWLHARPRGGNLPGMGSAFDADVIELKLDTASLYPSVHRGWIRLSAWRSPDVVTVPVRVTILGRPIEMKPVPISHRVDPHPIPAIVVPPSPARQAAPAPESHAHATAKAAAPAKPAPTSKTGRLSRSAAFKSRFLPTKTNTPSATPQAKPEGAKPSPVGKPVADAHGVKPAAGDSKAGHGTPKQEAKAEHGTPKQEPKSAPAAPKPAAGKQEGKGAAPAKH